MNTFGRTLVASAVAVEDKTMKHILRLALVAALGAGSMFANTITDPSIPGGTIAAPGTFLFAQFNAALGTLTDITVNISDSATGSVNIFNPTGGSLSYTSATVSVPFTLTFTGGPGTFTFNASATDSTPGTLGPGGSVTVTGLTGTGSSNVDLGTNGAYVGSGNTPVFSLSGQGAAAVTGNGAAGLLYGGSATGSVQATITYTYTPITSSPEPTTMLLFGSALVGLGCFRKRAQKKS
jgi:hypothetical protein